MAKVSTNISLDEEVKREGIKLFNELGLDLSTAITLFIKQAIREKGLPFEVTTEVSDKTMKKLLKERKNMIEHPEKYKRYDSIEEAMKEI